MNNFNFEELSFYAIKWDGNNEKPKYINVLAYLDSLAFSEAVMKYKTITNYEELYRWVSRELKYIFFSHAQYEMRLSGLFDETLYKLDVWSQIVPNIDKIVDIVNDGFGLNFTKDLNKVKTDTAFIEYEEV